MTPYLSLKPKTQPYSKPTPWQMYLMMRALKGLVVEESGPTIDSLSPSSFVEER